MNKKIFISKTLPALGPYSTAVEAGGMIFLSGQLPVHPVSGEIITDIQPAARQVLTHIKSILEENGLSLDHVVKTTLFLKNMADFSAVNEVYAAFFTSEPPARSTVEVSALPKGAPLEIEAVAVKS